MSTCGVSRASITQMSRTMLPKVPEMAGPGPLRSHRQRQSRPDRVDDSPVGLRTHVTANDLQTHLVCAITARTNGRVQALRVQIQGGRTVLSGFAESYYAIQLAVAGLMETLDALGLDRPGRVDLNIDVMPSHSARPCAADT